MNEVRAYLDALMGPNRDGDGRGQKHFSDTDVCRDYLCGLCPNDLFVNTRADLGTCQKLHSEPLRADYEQASLKKEKDYGYDYEHELHLQRLHDQCQRNIQRAEKRLESNQKQSNTEADKLAKDIVELHAQAERLGEEGKVDESLAALARAEELKNSARQLTLGGGGDGQQQQQNLRVCEVCGALLSAIDTDKGLADHFGGKLHLGYLRIQERLKELKDARKQRSQEKREQKDKGRDRDRDRDKARDRSYSGRSRPRERERDRNHREYNRDRDRDYREKREHDRSREGDDPSKRHKY